MASEEKKDELNAALVLMARSVDAAQALLEQEHWAMAAEANKQAQGIAQWMAWRDKKEQGASELRHQGQRVLWCRYGRVRL